MPLRPARFPTQRPHLGKKARGLARRGKFRDRALQDKEAETVVLDEGHLFIRRSVPSAVNTLTGSFRGVAARRGAEETSDGGPSTVTPATGLLGSWGSVLSTLPLSQSVYARPVEHPALHFNPIEEQIPPHRHTRRPSLLQESRLLHTVASNPLSTEALREMRSKRAEDPTVWSTTALARHFQVSRQFVSMAAPLSRPASRRYVQIGEARESNLGPKSLERVKTLKWQEETRKEAWGKIRTEAREDRQRRRAKW